MSVAIAARKFVGIILRFFFSLDNLSFVKFIIVLSRPCLSDTDFMILLRQVSPKCLNKLDLKFIVKLKKLPVDTSYLLKIKTLQEQQYEQIAFPKIYDISSGGSLNILCPEISLYKFINAEFNPLSDIICTGDGFYCDKFQRFQSIKLLPQDQDLIHYDKTEQVVYLNKGSSIKYYGNCFSLCGVNSDQWGHFVANFLPKIYALNVPELKSQHLNILVPDTIDDHIYEMIRASAILFCLNFSIQRVSHKHTIVCKKLFYCGSPSYVADHGFYQHPTDVVLTKWALSALKYIASNIKTEQYSSSRRKIFIGRKGFRNIINYTAVESFFTERGYDVIYPHTLSFSQKLRLFSEASHVVGAYSSGFANVIFCNSKTKLLAFSNFSRTTDSYLSSICNFFQFDLMTIVGEEILPTNSFLHTSYSVPLDKVKEVSDRFGL